MRRMLARPMAVVTALAVAVGMIPWAPAFAAEQRQASVRGRHTRFGTLTQAGALTLIYRNDNSGAADFSITGYSTAKNFIDGRNYYLNGNLVGSGDREGVGYDFGVSYLAIDGKETITGSPATQSISTIDVKSLVNNLKPYANTTYTSTTTLTNQTIGGPDNFQVVLVNNTKLTLAGTSKGYGLLIINDTTPGQGQASLTLTDQAQWYGVIVAYTEDSQGAADKIKLQFGKTPSPGAPGSGTRVFGTILLEGRQVRVDFPTKSVVDVLYSSAAVAKVDAMLDTVLGQFIWDKWREN